MKHMQLEPKETFKTLHLYNIQIDASLQSRVDMYPHKTADYQKAYTNGTELPPLLVAMSSDSKGDFSHQLIDGWHRYQALLNLYGLHKRVKVKVLEVPEGTSIHRLRFLGGRENLKNGIPLNSKDRRALFTSYVKSNSNRDGNRYKSYREIAKDLSVIPHQTIARWMQKEFNAIARAMGKDSEDKFNSEPSVNSGGRIPNMPNLSSRDRGLFYADILEAVKISRSDTRDEVIHELKQLMTSLEAIQPFEPIQLEVEDDDSDGIRF